MLKKAWGTLSSETQTAIDAQDYTVGPPRLFYTAEAIIRVAVWGQGAATKAAQAARPSLPSTARRISQTGGRGCQCLQAEWKIRLNLVADRKYLFVTYVQRRHRAQVRKI